MKEEVRERSVARSGCPRCEAERQSAGSKGEGSLGVDSIRQDLREKGARDSIAIAIIRVPARSGWVTWGQPSS